MSSWSPKLYPFGWRSPLESGLVESGYRSQSEGQGVRRKSRRLAERPVGPSAYKVRHRSDKGENPLSERGVYGDEGVDGGPAIYFIADDRCSESGVNEYLLQWVDCDPRDGVWFTYDALADFNITDEDVEEYFQRTRPSGGGRAPSSTQQQTPEEELSDDMKFVPSIISSRQESGHEGNRHVDSKRLISQSRHHRESNYVMVEKPNRFFKVGRIFMTPWIEPLGSRKTEITNVATLANGEHVFSEVRQFVVVREGPGCSLCCALHTYQDHMILERSSRPGDFAIVTTKGDKVQCMLCDDTLGMEIFPIIIEDPFSNIQPELRLDFTRIYTVEHDVKVRKIGRVDRDYLKALKTNFANAVGGSTLEDIEENNEVFSAQRKPTNEIRDLQIFAELQKVSPSSTSLGIGNKDNGDLAGKVEGLDQPLEGPRSEDVSQALVEHISDPESGISDCESALSIRHITAEDVSTTVDRYNPEYRVHPGKDFKFGRIFKMLWTEPRGETSRKQAARNSRSKKYEEQAYTSVRRFVIIRESAGHSICLPILTYSGRATSKPGIKPQHHAIIYTEKPAGGLVGFQKPINPKSQPGEDLTKKSILMEPYTPRDQLDPLSRLNYAKVYTIEWNMKVCFIGKVHGKSAKYLIRDYNIIHAPLPEDPDTEYSSEESLNNLEELYSLRLDSSATDPRYRNLKPK